MEFLIIKASELGMINRFETRRNIETLEDLLNLASEFDSDRPQAYMFDKLIIDCAGKEIIIYDDYID